MVELSRRAVLSIAASSGAFAALSAKAQTLGAMWPRPDPREAARWIFLQPAEVEFLIAAIDRLIPEDEFPSGSQAGVVDYIDLQLATDWGNGEGLYLAGPFHPQEASESQGYQLPLTPAELYREAIAALSEMLDRPFHTLTPDEQDRVLTMLSGASGGSTGDPGPASGAGGGSADTGSSGAQDGPGAASLEAARGAGGPEASEEGGSAGQSTPIMLGTVPATTFFDILQRNANEGYFADPIHGGNFDMIGWRMVGFPGADAYYTDTVDKHGMEYFRPPSAIRGAASGRVGDGATADGGPQRVRFTNGGR